MAQASFCHRREEKEGRNYGQRGDKEEKEMTGPGGAGRGGARLVERILCN